MTTLTILYLIFAKDASIKDNKFITPTIMKRILYTEAIKNKVRSYISKSLWKDFQNWWGENNILTFKDLPTFFFLKKHKQKIEDGKNIIFLNPSDTENGFFIETGWTSIGSKIKVPNPTKSVTKAMVPGTNNREKEALAAYSAVWPSITSFVI